MILDLYVFLILIVSERVFKPEDVTWGWVMVTERKEWTGFTCRDGHRAGANAGS
jgi:hypothetical protein